MNIKQVQALIVMLRKERITYTTLSAGGITLDGVVDGKLERDATKPVVEPRQSMFERYGAELLKQPATKSTEIVPDEAMLE